MKQLIYRLRVRAQHHHETGSIWFVVAVAALLLAVFFAFRIQL
jgi:hypothetical protein